MALGLGPAGGCSTVDRDPIADCNDDDDCGDQAVCSLAQGNICVPAELPPLTVLGFDIIEGDLRVELQGCDPEITRELAGTLLRVQKRESLIKSHQLRASESRPVLNCGGGECEGVCDEDALTCTTQTDKRLGLSSLSRLGLADLSSSRKDYVTVPDQPVPEGELPPPVEFIWPSYESDDERAHASLELEVAPPEGATSTSTYWRVIAEDAPEELEATGRVRCQRAIVGNEGAVRTLAGSPVPAANIEFIYNEAIASSSTVLGTGRACVDDLDCALGWACNLEGSCGLDLSGVSAGSSISLEDPAGAFPPAQLYTYCEDSLADPLERQFLVRVTPPADSGLPNMIYDLNQGFALQAQPDILKEVTIDGVLCLPNWQPPQAISFSLEGDPVALTETELGVYECCSTECLPSNEPEVEPPPPPTLDSCQNFGEVNFETRWYNPNLAVWQFAGCVPTAANSDGSSGILVRNVKTCDDEGCSVSLTTGDPDEDSRNYRVSIVQPVGSAFRSQRFNLTVGPETTEFEPFELEPRVLLRGEIVCISEGCSASNAVVAAERLRVDTDDSDPSGPFYYQARVNAAGSFVLPVDPGVYVVTAYPAVGQPGGPAPFQVLDLREGSPMLADIDGVFNAVLGDPLQLDDGVLVQVHLRDFEVSSTKVTPLDTGSWAEQSGWPGIDGIPELTGLDLNDPLACHGSSTLGCQIRRVRPGGPTATPISLLIDGRFQFTTRKRGETACGG
ncbi:hypothetical protein [Enhygromyxa salina]|uniref:hypothetical protein n=1 Tax=Enhygromyxa salina TaxID=215803 RepID=UPI000D0915B8|nr:hypothetical protein [Enhygromyxa salina]